MSLDPDAPRDYALNAGVIAASASLPMQLLPVFFLSLSREDAFVEGTSSLWAGVYFVAQLFAGFLLPLIGHRLGRREFIGLGVFWLIAALLLNWTQSPVPLAAIWFCIGLFSGTAHYVSIVVAAQHRDRKRAFSVRLSLPLLLSGVFLVLSGSIWRALPTAINFKLLVVAMLFVMAVVYIVALGTMTFNSPSRTVASGSHAPVLPWTTAAFLLGGCAAFFATQIWFMSNIIIFAGGDESGGRDAMFSIGIARVLTGFCLLLLISRLKLRFGPVFWIASPILAISSMLSFWIGDSILTVFFFAVLLFELSLNVLSAQFLAFIADNGGAFVTKWLTASVLGGAAFGLIAMQALASLTGVGLCLVLVTLGAFAPVVLRQIIPARL